MIARWPVAALFLLALLVERFGYYHFRMQFMAVLLARGVERDEAHFLYGHLTGLVFGLLFIVAVLAAFVPRTWVAAGGALVALAGYAAITLGPGAELGVWTQLLACGVAALKVGVVCAAADAMASPRARLLVGVVAYAALNVGATLAPLGSLNDTPGEFARTSVAAASIVVLLCTAGVALARAMPMPKAAADKPYGLSGVLFVLPVQAFLWLMTELQPHDLDVPWWAFHLNPAMIVALAALVALVLGLAPARALGWWLAGSFALGLGLATGGLAGVGSRDLSTWLGSQTVIALAEVCIAVVGYGFVLACVPPRWAPIALASTSSTGPLVSSIAGSAQSMVWLGVLGVLAALGLGLFVAARRVTLGLLDPERLQAS